MWPLSVARLAGERSEPGCRNGVYWGTSVPFIRVKWANHFFIFILEGTRRFLSMFSSFWPAIVLSRLVKSYSLNFYFYLFNFFQFSIEFAKKMLLMWLIVKFSPTGFPLKHFEQSVHFKKGQKSGPIRSKKWRNFKKGQKLGPIRSKKWRKSGPIRNF